MDDSSKKPPPWEKPLVQTVPEVEFTRNEDLSTQDTLRARNDSHARHASSLSDIFPGIKLPEDEGRGVGVFPNPPPENTTHGNNNSNIGPSNHRRTASALRAEGPASGISKPAHRRQVSWGLENNTKLEIDAENSLLQQPTLAESNITLPDGTNLSIPSLPFFHPNRGGSGRISLEDLRSARPLEAEAEQYLIRALEKRDPLGSSRNLDMNSAAAVLSNIPQEDLDALRPDPDNASVGSQSNRNVQRNNHGDDSEGSQRSTVLRRDKSTRSGGGPPPVRHRRTETVSIFRRRHVN